MSFSLRISTARSIAASRSVPASSTSGPAPTNKTNPSTFSLSAEGSNAWAVLNASALLLYLTTLFEAMTEEASIGSLTTLKFFFRPQQKTEESFGALRLLLECATPVPSYLRKKHSPQAGGGTK